MEFKGGGDFADVEKKYHEYNDLEDDYGRVVISDPNEARKLLSDLVQEVHHRMGEFKKNKVANITEYNKLPMVEKFIPWLVVFDELAEVLGIKIKNKAEQEMYNEIDQSLRTLIRLSRAAGIHIICGLIRPSRDILDGSIKSCISWRISSHFVDPADSEVAIGSRKAIELDPEIKGRFASNVNDEEFQAFYLPPKI